MGATPVQGCPLLSLGCLSCPAGTEPALGLEYKWWNVLPPNMETTVLSGINFEYKGMAGSARMLSPRCPLLQGQPRTLLSHHHVLTGWEVAGDYIYTAAGASDNDFMILTLVVPGFR